MTPGPIVLAIAFALIVGAVQGELVRRSPRVGSVLFAWLVITGVLGFSAALHDFSRIPPRFPLLFVASFVVVYFGSYFSGPQALLEKPGLAWLIGLQVFRVAVELFLFLGHRAGFVPVQMTMEGRNFDVITGLTALPMAWLVAKKLAPRWSIYAWNTMGLALLLNVVLIAVLSMPTPLRRFHDEPANTFVTYFPYVWLPLYLVQMAWMSHLLIYRAAKNQPS